MTQRERVGLVGAGSIRNSPLTRMPSLLGRLGPVKCASFSAAKRLVTATRAGYAVNDYMAFEGCRAVIAMVPDRDLDGVLTDLAVQPWLRRTPVVLFGTVRDSWSAQLVRARGGKVATLNAVDNGRDGQYVAEGHPDAVRLLRRCFTEDNLRLIEIRTGGKASFLAGVHLATDLLRPWVDSAVECLRAAGFTRPEATALAEALCGRSLKTHLKAGNKTWAKPVTAELLRALATDIDRMRRSDERRAELYAAGLRHALEYSGKKKKAAVG